MNMSQRQAGISLPCWVSKVRVCAYEWIEYVKMSFFSHLAVETKENELERNVCRLLENYENDLLRLAYAYVHTMSDAEEIVQETMIRYVKHQPVFKNPQHEKAWLLRVAANLSKNRLRYNQLRKTDELNETLVSNEREDLSFVWEAVKALPMKYREVVHLYYYEGISTSEIAKIVKRKESSVRTDLYRARVKLKEILKEVMDHEEGV